MDADRPTQDGPFAGSTLTCTGSTYGTDPCNCIYHVLTRAFTPQPPDRPLRQLRVFVARRKTPTDKQTETFNGV